MVLGDKSSAKAAKAKPVSQQEIDMMSDDFECKQPADVGKDGEERKEGCGMNLGFIMTPEDNKMEDAVKAVISTGSFKEAMASLAKNSAKCAVEGMSEQIQILQQTNEEQNKVIRGNKEEIEVLKLQIGELKREKNDMENQNIKNKIEIDKKEKEIQDLKKELRIKEILLEEEKGKALVLKKELSAEKAKHQQSKSQANVNMRKLKEKMRGSMGHE